MASCGGPLTHMDSLSADGPPPERLGLAVASVRGEVVASGDAETTFPLRGIAKPFVFPLVWRP